MSNNPTPAPEPTPAQPPPSDVTETITLRRATAQDAAALALTGAATFLEAFTWMLPGPDILAHTLKHHSAQVYAEYLAQPQARITLAVTGPAVDFPQQPGSVVGYVLVCTPELPSFAVLPTDLELKRIYLFSRFRTAPVLDPSGHPIPNLRPAQALLDAALADACTLGARRMLLGTYAGNTRAIAFYRRNWFQQAGTRLFQVGSQQCSDLIFARPIESTDASFSPQDPSKRMVD
ncbi:MAG: GNAT family N-acetyltransferase [Acidobacteriaceae bacterium]